MNVVNKTEFIKNDLRLIEEDHIIKAIIKAVICVVGVTGNSINLFVLTRNKINITAIYLIAISTVDILRLLSASSYTLEYFQWIHLGYEIYWKYRPILSCITFSTQGMSLLLIVSFSINRYVAVSNPYKKNFLNKKLVNQCIIVGIVIISFVARIPITMNIVSKEYVDYNEMTHKFCKNSTLNGISLNITEINNNYTKLIKSIDIMNSENMKIIQLNEGALKNTTEALNNTSNLTYNKIFNSPENISSHCNKILYYTSTMREKNRPAAWYRMTIATVFGLIPLLILVIINIKIIIILRESSARRSVLTNSVILHQNVQPGSQKAPLIAKENRTILHLIIIKAVIALLRLPYFAMMYFLDILKFKQSTFSNVLLISSYSLDINATLNFFLFCILPENYRKQFIETMSKCCQCCKARSKNIDKIKNSSKSKDAHAKVNTSNSGITNTAFISDNINPISIVSEFPGEQPLQQAQSKNQNQQENQHPKLEQHYSTTSTSSGSTFTSQISQTSESSVI